MFNDNIPFVGRDSQPTEDTVQAAPAEPEYSGRARIKVIGVGGAGNNAINRMIDAGITSAEYVAVNTDAQILACSKAKTRIQIGAHLTKGLGAGADPDIGRAAAEENKEELARAIENTDLLFITAGMGGGTGTGAAPVIAKMAKDMKILTVAVVTEPFSFEGRRRMDNTIKGLEVLKKNVDTLVIIPNEKISEVAPKNASMPDALRIADEVLKQGIRGIADLIVTPALINLDFADVRTVLKDKGLAHMGVGVAKGENRIFEAVRCAVQSPLLETTIEGATGIILNIVGGNDLTFEEVKLAASLVHSVVDYSANIIFGACIDENISDEVEVTVIATGFPPAGSHTADAQQQQGYRPAQPQQPPRPVSQADILRRQPAQPVQQPVPPAQPAQPVQAQQPPRGYGRPVYEQPAQPAYPRPEYERPEYPKQPVQAQNGYEEAAAGYEPPKAQEEEPTVSGRDQQLPDFVKRLIGKRK